MMAILIVLSKHTDINHYYLVIYKTSQIKGHKYKIRGYSLEIHLLVHYLYLGYVNMPVGKAW